MAAAQQISKVLTNVAWASLGLGFAATGLQSTCFIVEGGHRGVVFDRFRGVLPDVRQEGLNFLIPWVQKQHIYDVRTKPKLISSVTGTKDLQMVNISLRVLHKPEVGQLPKIFQRLGIDYDERVLPSIGNEVLKAVVAQYNAVQLLTHREQVSNQLRKILSERAQDFHIELEDVAITHLSFGAEFARAIEQKQVAEQDAERAKFVVQKSEQERQAAIIRAEGESQAAKLISDATAKAGPGLVELRRIEAAKEITSSLARQRNVVYMPQESNVLMQMPQP